MSGCLEEASRFWFPESQTSLCPRITWGSWSEYRPQTPSHTCQLRITGSRFWKSIFILSSCQEVVFPQPACSWSSSLQKHLSPDNNSWSHWYRGPEVLKRHEAKHTFKKLFIKSCLLTTSHLGIIISQYSWHLVETTSLRFFHHVITLQWLSEFLQDKRPLFISDAHIAWTFQFSENQNWS